MNKVLGIDNVQKLDKILRKIFRNYEIMTDVRGHTFDNERQYYKKAEMSCSINQCIKDGKSSYWVPFSFNNTKLGSCRLSGLNEYPTKELKIINDLTSHIIIEKYFLSKISDIADARSSFIKDLLISGKNDERLIKKGDLLDINLRLSRAVVVAELPNSNYYFTGQKNDKIFDKISSVKNNQKVMHEVSSILGLSENNVIAQISDKRYVILVHSENDDLLKINKYILSEIKKIKKVFNNNGMKEVYFGIGNYYQGIKGIKASYEEALAAIEVGPLLDRKNRIFHICDVFPICAISNMITVKHNKELLEQYSNAIFEDKFMLKSLNSFLNNNLNTTLAAKDAHIHRNTLIYRLNKIKKDTGLDPHNFIDAFKIKLILLLKSF